MSSRSANTWMLVFLFAASVILQGAEDKGSPAAKKAADPKSSAKKPGGSKGAEKPGEKPAEEPAGGGEDQDSQPAGAPAEGAPALEDPEFSKASSTTDFEKAKMLFESAKYKEAEAILKRVKSDGKAKKDKEIIEKWIQGTAGGLLVERLRSQLRTPKKDLYEQAKASYPKYKDTPAGEIFRIYIGQLEAELYQLLEGFEITSALYRPEFGKKFISDPGVAYDGAQCLEWTNTKDRKAAALKIENVPKDWSLFDALEFWVSLKLPPPASQVVIMCGVEANAKPKGQVQIKKKSAKAKENHLYAPLRFTGQPGQWQLVRLSLSSFKAMGKASLSDVAYLQIQVPAGSEFSLLIDKISLVRKETPGGGAEVKPPREAPAGGKQKSGGKR